jgi:hypothetical protein
MRGKLPLLVFIGLAAMAAAALAQVSKGPQARAAQAIAATGAFEISNSRDGQPIFAAAGIAPGDSTSGTVVIKDTGSEATALTLHSGEVIDEPGIGGGLLSGRLQLNVVDVSVPAAPVTVYAGPLDSMPAEPAGILQGGESRTYEFTATLPDDGEASFQNEVQGASTTVAYTWVAGEASGGEGPGPTEEPTGGEETKGGETPGGTGGGETPSTPSPGAGTASAEAAGSAGSQIGNGGAGTGRGGGNGGVRGQGAVLDLTVPRIKGSLRRGRLRVWTDCTKTCRLSIRGRLRAKSTTTGTRRVARVRWSSKTFYPAGPHRIRLRIPRAMRTWMKQTPGPERLRARLRFTAVGKDGERDVVRKTVRLRGRH